MERLRVSQNPLKKAGLFVGGGIAAVAISCAPGAGRTENPAPSPAVPTASGETLTPPSTQTPEPTVAPTAASTPEATHEAKQEVPCQTLFLSLGHLWRNLELFLS